MKEPVSHESMGILVVGGGVVARDVAGRFYTKSSIAEYLHEIAGIVGRSTWIAEVAKADYGVNGELDQNLIHVIPFRSTRKEVIVACLKALSVSKRHRYLLYFLPNRLGPIFPLLRIFARRIVVYLANDYEVTLRSFETARPSTWQFAFRLSYELPMKMADAVIARGKRLAGLAGRFNTRVYETVPIGYLNLGAEGHDPFDESGAGGALRILYVGKLLWEKGVGDLISSFAMLTKGHPGAALELHLAGDGKNELDFRELATSENVAGSVRFHGWIDAPRQLDQLFRQSHVLVVPSNSYPEGVPRVIDEALCRGVPVIATEVGGIPAEFSSDEVMLVKPGRPPELAEAIRIILTDRETRERFSRGAHRRRRMWEKVGTAAQQHATIVLGRSQ